MVGFQLVLAIASYLIVSLALEHLVVILVVTEVNLVRSQLLRVLIFINVFLMRLLQTLMILCHHRLRHHLLHIYRHIRLVTKTPARLRMSDLFRRAFNCNLIGRHIAMLCMAAQRVCVLARIEYG